MMETSHYEPALWRILWELRPYLDQVVIIGGWVPYLYRRYGGFASWTAGFSLTAEVDVLVDRPLPSGDRPTIPEILHASGFRPTTDVGGGAVWLGDVAAGEKIEFLVPHTGTGRQLGMIVPIAPQGGMHAISLPGLELLRRHRRSLRIPLPTAGGDELEVWGAVARRVRGQQGIHVHAAAVSRGRREQEARQGPPVPARRRRGGRRSDGARRGRPAGDEARQDGGDAHPGCREHAATRRLRQPGKGIPQAAAMLREREPSFSEAAALSDLRGSLADLLDVLGEALDGRG
jgi:hypothetical protein